MKKKIKNEKDYVKYFVITNIKKKRELTNNKIIPFIFYI